jgi:NitT/TauT family transport system permease protein
MIGATSGLGWYVQYFADLSQYDRVVAGILYISFVVFIIIAAYERLQRYALRWRGQDQN